ncbi:kinase-like protein [Neoconidiobolus thromboides FSU 785]|nr:kinase-like protein [Neoconidiobolus thromboides FSU 785]
MARLNHPNIAKYEGCFHDSTFIYILIELCENGDLNQLIKRRNGLTDCEVRYFALQIRIALEYMHTCNIIHRDLKPGNVLITKDMKVKISDFGLAAICSDRKELRKTFCGTPNYAAPEMFTTTSHHNNSVDFWSFGVLLYTMRYKTPPFNAKTDVGIVRNLIRVKLKFPGEPSESLQLKNLIVRLLTPQPLNRPAIDDIKDHEFFKGYTPMYLPLTILERKLSLKQIAEWDDYMKEMVLERSNGKEFDGSDVGKGDHALNHVDNKERTNQDRNDSLINLIRTENNLLKRKYSSSGSIESEKYGEANKKDLSMSKDDKPMPKTIIMENKEKSFIRNINENNQTILQRDLLLKDEEIIKKIKNGISRITDVFKTVFDYENKATYGNKIDLEKSRAGDKLYLELMDLKEEEFRIPNHITHYYSYGNRFGFAHSFVNNVKAVQYPDRSTLNTANFEGVTQTQYCYISDGLAINEEDRKLIETEMQTTLKKKSEILKNYIEKFSDVIKEIPDVIYTQKYEYDYKINELKENLHVIKSFKTSQYVVFVFYNEDVQVELKNKSTFYFSQNSQQVTLILNNNTGYIYSTVQLVRQLVEYKSYIDNKDIEFKEKLHYPISRKKLLKDFWYSIQLLGHLNVKVNQDENLKA